MFAVSLAADLQLYLIHTAVPFKALHLGAGPLALGGLVAATTGTYALTVAFSGRASDRIPRLLLARVCCLGVILSCIGLTLAGSLSQLFACMPLVGASMAFFWPSVQASIADRSSIDDLPRNLGRFNLAWSVGKGCGFLCGGILLAALGPAAVFTISSATVLLIFFVLPAPSTMGPIDALVARIQSDARPPSPKPAPQASVSIPASTAASHIDPRTQLFRRIAWIANCTAFGVAATLAYHYPNVVAERNWSPRVFGTLLGLIYLIQTFVFAFLMHRPDAWRFRRLRLYLPQLVMAVAMAALPLADFPLLGASAVVFGIGLGMCYFSSIYYSLLAHEGRGRNAGVHEALIGLGGMVIPLAGGAMARAMGSTMLPFWTAAAVILLSLVAQEAIYSRGRLALRGGQVGTSGPRRPERATSMQ